ncbi:unnamed protein product [Orchesella dallaii]|uniref:Aminotransferase class V domain-containing protein n=1 Tax=Orchesella dallaii TaxID=48710 RepID=A0ABP1R025_9HEXA
MKLYATITVVLLVLGVHAGNGGKRQLPALGRPMREAFYMDPDFVQLNHGAYGTYPKVVGDALREYQQRSERNPDLWLRRDAKTELAKVRQMLADLVNADSADVVMVPNTTGGINAVFRSLVFAAGERILHLSSIYNSMGSIIQYLVDYSNGSLSKLVFDVTYPMSNEDFLLAFETFLNQTEDPAHPIRIALIDHITSVPSIVNPIERIIPMLKQRNISVLIDGAHAIGQVPINITALQPDYYVTNCHKWLYAARGCALLYVDKKYQGEVHPAQINSGYSQPANFQNEFFWTGTMDYSSYMTVPTALQFRREAGGEDVIMKYNHDLAYNGGRRMAELFGTSIMQDEEQIGSMVDVRLPVNNPDDSKLDGEWWIDEQLYRHPNTFSSVYKHNGSWWVRVSAQIYNDLSDFELSAQHFLDICNELNMNDQTTTTSTTTTSASTTTDNSNSASSNVIM